MTVTVITSNHNQKLKEIRKLRMRRRDRERLGRFVAEGEDLLAAADAAGWEAVDRFAAAGSGLAGLEVDGKLLADASGLGSGTRTLAVYEERWAPAPSVRCACICTASTTPETSAPCCARPRRSAPRAWRAGRGRPIRSARRRSGRAWARSSASRSPARPIRRHAGALPGTTIALVAGAGHRTLAFQFRGVELKRQRLEM